MAERACHGFGSTTQVGLTQALEVMARFLALLLAIFLTSCAGQRPAAYESFLQVNPATKLGHAFVLVQVTGDSEDGSPLDAGLAKFVLAPGESQAQTFRNKNFPGREYIFTARIEDKAVAPLVSTTIVIEEQGLVLHRSSQTVYTELHF